MDAAQLRAALGSAQREIRFKQTLIEKITHENAILKRLKFAATSEAYTSEQRGLFLEAFDADQAAVAAELAQRQPGAPTGERKNPKRQALPPGLPRREVRHEPVARSAAAARR